MNSDRPCFKPENEIASSGRDLDMLASAFASQPWAPLPVFCAAYSENLIDLTIFRVVSKQRCGQTRDRPYASDLRSKMTVTWHVPLKMSV